MDQNLNLLNALIYNKMKLKDIKSYTAVGCEVYQVAHNDTPRLYQVCENNNEATEIAQDMGHYIDNIDLNQGCGYMEDDLNF